MDDAERKRNGSACAACKTLKRKCPEKCLLAPYFPPSNCVQFANAHQVFGVTAIVETIQDLPMEQRDVAVRSIVYEATARVNDPVQGCAGIVFQLQKQVLDLQAQLANAQAELLKMQSQQAALKDLISGFRTSVTADSLPTVDWENSKENTDPRKNFLDELDIPLDSLHTLQQWEPLWSIP